MYGFDQKSRNFLTSYLSERMQVVIVGASISKPVTTSIGSPQGAVLSTTCFIILVADIGLWSKSEIFSYADNTCSTLATATDKEEWYGYRSYPRAGLCF